MAEVLTIVIFFGIIAVTALIFGVWFMVTITRAIFRGLQAMFMPHRLPPMPAATRGRVCANDRCRALNPAIANFCRRCGSGLPQTQQVNVRRAAIF